LQDFAGMHTILCRFGNDISPVGFVKVETYLLRAYVVLQWKGEAILSLLMADNGQVMVTPVIKL
jgi:hypothetical protein